MKESMILGPRAFSKKAKVLNIFLFFLAYVSFAYVLWQFFVLMGGYKYLMGPPSVSTGELLDSTILTPIWEEAMYRWAPIMFALRLSKKRELVMPTIVFVSCFFGWEHGYDTHGIVFQGLFGFMSSILFLRNNNSYWSCVIFHMLWNALCLYTIDNVIYF